MQTRLVSLKMVLPYASEPVRYNCEKVAFSTKKVTRASEESTDLEDRAVPRGLADRGTAVVIIHKK